jgi:hypothetical protein
MNFSPGSPVFIILIIVLFFGVGVLVGKMFKKKKAEKFSGGYTHKKHAPKIQSFPRVLMSTAMDQVVPSQEVKMLART